MAARRREIAYHGARSAILPALLTVILAAVIAGCTAYPEPSAAQAASGGAATSATATPDRPPAGLSTASNPATPSSAATPSATASGAATHTAVPSLVGDSRDTWAFAPLDHPDQVTVEGSVPSQRAWSTSKVLVVCAFLQTVAHGDPAKLTDTQRTAIVRALTESHMPSLLALRGAIPGGSGAPMTAILRSIGDRTTSAPDTREGTMQWTVREQVRFLAALAHGQVVNAAVSRFVLQTMHPVPSQGWGLGRVGASAVKGGWLRADTETRQMGILDGYAVAVLTAGVGPAVLQSDGDFAHVARMNQLAAQLDARLRG